MYFFRACASKLRQSSYPNNEVLCEEATLILTHTELNCRFHANVTSFLSWYTGQLFLKKQRLRSRRHCNIPMN